MSCSCFSHNFNTELLDTILRHRPLVTKNVHRRSSFLITALGLSLRAFLITSFTTIGAGFSLTSFIPIGAADSIARFEPASWTCNHEEHDNTLNDFEWGYGLGQKGVWKDMNMQPWVLRKSFSYGVIETFKHRCSNNTHYMWTCRGHGASCAAAA